MKKYGFGADVGGTTIKMGLFETDGTLLEKWEIPTDTSEKGAHILQDIAATVHGKMVEKDLTKDMVEGIGIGVPGAVDKDGVVHRAVNLGWDVVPLAEELERLSGMKVKVGNDANVAALGENWMGSGKGYNSIVMVTLGTGIGGGIIIDGKILTGANGAAGEIGHMIVNEQEIEACNCGHSAKDVCDCAKAGDKVACDVINQVFGMLGSTLAKIGCVLNPDVFVIGGGVSRAGQIIIDALQEPFCSQVFHASKDTPIVLASLGNDAGIYGAVRMLLS